MALDTNDFRIGSIEIVDGEPKVEWEPKVNRWTGAEIQAVMKGAERLEGPWEDVSAGTARPEGSPHLQDVGKSAVLARWIQWWIRCF